MLPTQLFGVILGHMIISLLQPFFWMIVAFIAYQYWQIQKMQVRMFGEAKYSLKKQVIYAVGFGLLGGFVGSILLVIVGVTTGNMGIEYVWPLALLLTVIHMRYLCFAYAGGLIAISSILFGWPAVNVPSLIALIAILHITESILIYISGRLGAIPLIMRTEAGELVGGFHLQNFWPLPLMLLFALTVPKAAFEQAIIKMPEWWPLIKPSLTVPEGQTLLYTATTVVAALGYADMAIASQPVVRRRQSARHLFIYSFILLVVAVLSYHYALLQIVAAILAPVGHEYLIWIDNQRERKGMPLFRPVANGVMVLDTIPGMLGEKWQLRPGDIIQRINEMPVYTRYDISVALTMAIQTIQVVVLTAKGTKQFSASIRSHERLGVITVPEGHETYYVDMMEKSAFDTIQNWFRKLQRKKQA